MSILTSSTTFTVSSTIIGEEETILILMPENEGADAFRELHYPDASILPPLIYMKNPDTWDNYDTRNMTERPVSKYVKTISAGQITRWDPYIQDNLIREVWNGGGSKMSMQAFFFRRLWEYFVNPPDSGYIEWWPKDRTTVGYYIEIESLSVGGQDVVTMDYAALSGGYILDTVELTFRIIGEIT